MIELHIAILKSNVREKALDPVIFLQGEPGVEALDMMEYSIRCIVKNPVQPGCHCIEPAGRLASQQSLPVTNL